VEKSSRRKVLLPSGSSMIVAVPEVSCSWLTKVPRASSVGPTSCSALDVGSEVGAAVGAASLTVESVKNAHGSNRTMPAMRTAIPTTRAALRCVMTLDPRSRGGWPVHNHVVRIIAASIAAIVLATGCGADPQPADDPPPTSSPTSAASPSPPGEPNGTEISTRSSEFGKMLFGPDRQAIYIWESEQTTKPECYGDCAEAWPPVLTQGPPQASGDVDTGILGTTKRKDGSTQVTYGGHPLYYYAHEGPGEVKCHNVATHGGLWWVVQPDGERAP
jgi:predicted lipoprotein with Yx(FWY)xxD motif